MSVIVTGMDMPTACKDCEYPNCDYYKAEWCRHGENSINYMTARSDVCPLKSVDGLIEEIEQCIESHERIAVNTTADRIRHNQMTGVYKHCIEIIKEYCEVKE